MNKTKQVEESFRVFDNKEQESNHFQSLASSMCEMSHFADSVIVDSNSWNISKERLWLRI